MEVDVTDVVWEEEVSQYQVYCHNEGAVEEVVEYDMEIVHVNQVNEYSYKHHLHKGIVVVGVVVAVGDDDDGVVAVVVVVVVVMEVDDVAVDDVAVAVAAGDGAAAAAARKGV